jgi:predicted site-specific integrase-resolvase
MRTFSTPQASKLIGIHWVTLRRWLADGKVRPSLAVPMDGRTLWRWTKADVERARRFKATQKPGRKSKKKKT